MYMEIRRAALLSGPVLLLSCRSWGLSVGFVLVLCACPSLPLAFTGACPG